MNEEYQLFIDKYVPQSFDMVMFNHECAKKLVACSKAIDIPHMIIKGCVGTGRKTFATLYLKEKYHLNNIPTHNQRVEIKVTSKKISLLLLYSDYHYIIDPSVHGVYDRLIIQGFLKDILQTKPISIVPYHTIIIMNADKLTIEAQQSLRRTLEKNVGSCRFIFIIEQEKTLIEPLISRCIQMRLSSPTTSQITDVLKNMCVHEKISYNIEQIQHIAHYSDRNVTKAMNTLQYISSINPSMLISPRPIDFSQININDQYLEELYQHLINAKQPTDILDLRQNIYLLLVQCVEPVDIMKKLYLHMVQHIKENKKPNCMVFRLTNMLSKYENTLKQGSKPIYHIEGFVVSIAERLANTFP